MDREALIQEDAETQLLREADERRFLYRDVEELIEVGFLTHTFNIEGSTVTLRSLLPQDHARFKVRSSGLREPYAILRWSIASSIWMINGFEISLDPSQNGAYYVHQEWVRNLPESVIDVLSTAVISFNRRVTVALRITEAFCYETYSRGLWRMQGRPGSNLRDEHVVRRMWAAYNRSEDDDKEDTRAWSHTRAIVGSMSNKGAKYLSEEMKKSTEKENTRRQGVIEAAVNWLIRGEEKKAMLTVMMNGEEVDVPRIHSAQTTEDLEEEMRRVFQGDADYHDRLVNDYQQKVKVNVLKRREERHLVMMEARRRAEEAEDRGEAPIVGYTLDQLEQMRPDVATTRTTAVLPASAKSNMVFDRFFIPNLRPGVLTPELHVEDVGAGDKRLKGPPKAEGPKPTLQEKIANRKPGQGEP